MNATDTFWLVILLVVAGATLTYARRRYGDHLSPAGIFIGVNSLSLIVYHFRLLEFSDVGTRTHIIVLAGLFSLVGASVLRLPSSLEGNLGLGRATSPSPITFRVVAALAIVGWMSSLALLMMRYGATHLLANIWILEKEFQMQYVGYLNLSGILVFPMYMARRCAGVARRLDLVLVILTVLGLLLAGIKQYVVFSSISAIVVYAVMRPGRIGLRHAAYVLIGIIAFFVLYDAVVDIFGTRTFPGSRFPEALSFLERPYLYFTGSWPAMDRIVMDEVLQQPIVGYITLQPLWKLLGDGLGLIEPVQRFLPFIDIGAHGYNVYSFMGEVYWDFGIVGVCLASFAAGWIGAGFYAKARSKGHWGYVLLYGIFAYGLVLSFFSYYYRFEMLLLLGLVAILAFVVDPLLAGRRADDQ